MEKAILKQQIIHSACQHLIEKTNRLHRDLNELQVSNHQNTKSTAGDKHETGRAMVHLEMEKLSSQLESEMKMLQLLEGLKNAPLLDKVSQGSVVFTNKGYYLIGASIGKFKHEQQDFFGLSIQSPLGQALVNRSKGDELTLNGNAFILEEVL